MYNIISVLHHTLWQQTGLISAEVCFPLRVRKVHLECYNSLRAEQTNKNQKEVRREKISMCQIVKWVFWFMVRLIKEFKA